MLKVALNTPNLKYLSRKHPLCLNTFRKLHWISLNKKYEKLMHNLNLTRYVKYIITCIPFVLLACHFNTRLRYWFNQYLNLKMTSKSFINGVIF
jgi:hypothetical protein